MAWTTPATRTAGEVLTAAIWNQQVRDNFLAIFPNAAGRMEPTAASAVGLVIRGKTSQTGNLQEWQDVAGTVLFSVKPTGYPGIGNAGFQSGGTASAGAGTLPSGPVGFFYIDIGGTTRRVPYYN